MWTTAQLVLGVDRLDHDASDHSEEPGAAGTATGYQDRRQSDQLPCASVPLLTEDSQIGANLRVCADEENRTDFDQRS
jgi:hypothetical protein